MAGLALHFLGSLRPTWPSHLAYITARPLQTLQEFLHLLPRLLETIKRKTKLCFTGVDFFFF